MSEGTTVGTTPVGTDDALPLPASDRSWAVVKGLALVLIVAASLVLWWAPLLSMGTRWVEDSGGATGHGVPGGAAVAGMLGCGVVATVVVAFLQWWKWYLAPLGALGGVGLGAIAVHELVSWPGDIPEGGDLNDPGAPPYLVWALVAGVALTVGWLLFSAVVYRNRRLVARFRGWPLGVHLMVLALFVLVALVAAPWYGQQRGVDHRTGTALPSGPAGVPRSLDTPGWTKGTTGSVRVYGRYVVVAEDSQVSVLDALTGDERWHYRRRQYPHDAPQLGISADGRTLLTLWTRFDPGVVLAGFDLATGELRWSNAQQVDEYTLGLDRLAGLTQIGGTVLALGGKGTVIGLDTGTGKEIWRWRVPDPCQRLQYLPAGDVLAVAVDCSGDRSYDGRVKQPDGTEAPAETKVLGISMDGKQKWSWTPPSPVLELFSALVGPEPAMAVVGDSLRVPTYRHGDVSLDPATGTPRHPGATHPTAPVAGRLFTILRGQSATVYLGDQKGSGDVAAIDDTGGTRWARDVPELDHTVVVSSTTVGDTGYALVLPVDASGLKVIGTPRLVALDLGTGAVRAAAPLAPPANQVNAVMAYPPTIQMYATGGGLVLVYPGADRSARIQAYR